MPLLFGPRKSQSQYTEIKIYIREKLINMSCEEPYFNIVPRTITPKRLRPPRPTTIALSDDVVLLKEHSPMLCLNNKRVITTNWYEKTQ